VNEYLGLDRSAGLTTALVGAADVVDLLQPWGDENLFILASGQIPPNPSELLGSAEMKSLIAVLEHTFDTVVIDAPPLLPVTDAAVLAQHVGGVVLVASAMRVRQNELERSLSALRLVDANILGIVLNRLPAKGRDSYGYGYYTKSEVKESFDRESRGNDESGQLSQWNPPQQVGLGDNSRDDIRPPSVFPPHR
jgi:capsular exopolysaccharide synthesis family protein